MKPMNIAKTVIAAAVMLTTSASAQVKPIDDAMLARAEAIATAAFDAMQEGGEDLATDAALHFNPSRDATADVDAALAAAQVSGRHVMLIMGGDWCHDSMALADSFATERFQSMLDARYELVWIHVPHDIADRSTVIARRFGLDSIVGTPTVLILNPSGQAINLADAPTWRNAASRKPAAIYRHFSRAVAPLPAASSAPQ